MREFDPNGVGFHPSNAKDIVTDIFSNCDTACALTVFLTSFSHPIPLLNSTNSLLHSGAPHRNNHHGSLWLAFLGLLTTAAIWEVAVRLLKVAPYILPTPSSIILKMFQRSDLIFRNAAITFGEAVGGLVFALCLGTLTALFFQLYPKIGSAGQPMVAGFQSFPKEAIAPLLVVWFGFGITSKLVIATSIAFFPVFLSTLKGLKGVPQEIIDTFSSLRASRIDVLLKARVPYSLPFAFSGLRVASTLSIVGAVIGEFLGSSAGLGHLILIANSQFSVDLVFGCLIVLGCMGICLDLTIQWIERKVVPWHESVSLITEVAR